MKFQENMTTELKREYTSTLIKSVIAFANTDGGNIYVGVEDDGTVSGVTNVDGTMQQIMNAIRDSVKPDITMFTVCGTEKIEDKTIVKIQVQKGTSSPYYLAGKGIRPEGVFVRQGSSSVPATETAILRMIKETDGERFENVRSLNQELTFEEAERQFKSREVPFGINQQRTMNIINANGLYTNLGLLLSDQCMHTIKLAVFEGADKSLFQDRREFTGSLLKQLEHVFEFIQRYNKLESKIKGLYRVDQRDYPEEAIREALLNAVVHRDYSYSGSTLINIFNNRIEFLSIGGLVKGITYDDVILGVSITRNENLANIFYRLTLIEAYGTGLPKIFRSYQGFDMEPKIETTDNAFKVTLPNIRVHTKLKEDHRFLTKNEQVVIKLLDEYKTVTRLEVETALDISQTMANKILKEMVSKDIIEVIGKGKNTRYLMK